MKNREVRAFIAGLMLVSLVAGSLAGAPLHAPENGNVTVTSAEYAAAENKETVKTGSETKSSETAEPKKSDKKLPGTKSSEAGDSDAKASSRNSSDAKPRKEETVYAKIDGSGSVKSVTVSDQLKNISSQSKLEDISDLQDIINVKGDEAFSAMGKSVVWDTADADICYQGTTSKKLPVGIQITYKLDGKNISAADLKGKSGHVVIRYTYENKSGSKGKAATPFMMATGLILDEETFKNVTVENGRLISDGERNMVIGYGLPAMKNILGIEEKDLDIPDYFEIEADVTEYEPVEGLTIATNSIFNDLDTDEFDSLDELNDSMDELQDASSQLVSGSGELKNGIDTLLASSGTLTDGIDQLVSGGGELQSGTSELADGSNELLDGSIKLADGSQELAEGNAKLADGTGQLYDGTKTLADGAGELNLGLKTAAENTRDKLLPGVQALDAGVKKMQGELGEQLEPLCSGISNLNNGAATLQKKTGLLEDGVNQVADGVNKLATNLASLNTKLNALESESAELAIQIATIDSSALSQQSTNMAPVENAGASAQANVDALVNQLSTIQYYASEAASEGGGANDGSGAAMDALYSAQSAIGAIEDPDVAAQVQGAVDNAIYAISSSSGGGTTSDAALQAAAEAAAAIPSAQAISADIAMVVSEAGNASDQGNNTENTQELMAKLNMLQGAVEQLSSTLSEVKGAVDQLNDGAQAANTGAQQLKGNMPDFQGGIKQLADGASALDAAVNDSSNGLMAQVGAGVAQLQAGTSQLVDGQKTLASGLDQLSAGAQKLDAGSTELSEKMGEANEGARTAATGAAELASGASELNSGASELASGASRLNDGALTLKDGLNTLQSGSGALIDGVQQLDDGAAELNDGMIRFDRDGIQKLVDAFGGDVEDLLDKMNEMLDASRAYKNFSGISDDMDGEVKFVFVTEE